MISILFQRPVIKRQLADGQNGELKNSAFEWTLHGLPLWIPTSALLALVPPEPSPGHLENAPLPQGAFAVQVVLWNEGVVSCNSILASQRRSPFPQSPRVRGGGPREAAECVCPRGDPNFQDICALEQQFNKRSPSDLWEMEFFWGSSNFLPATKH